MFAKSAPIPKHRDYQYYPWDRVNKRANCSISANELEEAKSPMMTVILARPLSVLGSTTVSPWGTVRWRHRVAQTSILISREPCVTLVIHVSHRRRLLARGSISYSLNTTLDRDTYDAARCYPVCLATCVAYRPIDLVVFARTFNVFSPYNGYR